MQEKQVYELKVIDKNILFLNGVNKIVSFNSKEFILETNFGPLHVVGDNLELQSIDVDNGNLRIIGQINGYQYIENVKKQKDDSILSKLFK